MSRLSVPWPALAAALLLAGCNAGPDDGAVRVSAIDDRAAPALSVGQLPLPESAGLLRAATAQGLVSFDAVGRVQPALALRWVVTDDGLSYIFRLGDTRWNDGTPVNARDVAATLTARLRELRRDPGFASELESISAVTAMTDRVVEIDLTAPRPSLLDILAQPAFGLVRRGAGSGPMRTRATLSPSPTLELRRRSFDAEGRESAGPRAVMLRAEGAALAITRFAAARSDVVLGGRFQHLPLLAASKVPGAAVQVDPVAGLFGLAVRRASGPLSTPAGREAMAMAIDRPKLLSSFNLAGWQEALTLVPEGLARRAPVGRPVWNAASMADRRATAAARIAALGTSATISIALPDGAGSRILFARLAEDWRGIGVTLVRAATPDGADLVLVDRVADFDSPLFYLAPLTCPVARLCDPDADALVTAARAATDLAQRTALLGEAELALTRFGNFIPIASPMRFHLVRPGLEGFAVNPRGRHLLQHLGEPTTSR